MVNKNRAAADEYQNTPRGASIVMDDEAESSFGVRVLGCIDRAMQVYGSNVTHVIFWHFKRTSSSLSSLDDVPERPEEFAKYLGFIFGDAALSVERKIAKEIRREFDLKEEEGVYGLCEAIEAARKCYVSLNIV